MTTAYQHTATACPVLPDDFDLRHLPDDFYHNPYPYYHALREHSPVRKMPDGSYLLTRYADLMQVYKDAKTFSSDKKLEFKPRYGDSLLYEHHTTSLVFNDPPLHTRVRRLIMGGLTPAAMANTETGLIQLVDSLLDQMAGKPGADLISDFASAIPVEIIGNLLAVPHDEREPLRAWSLAILGALEPAITPEFFAHANQCVTEFLDYLKALVADRRLHPGDPKADMLTRLIEGEADGEKLTETELLQNCVFLLNAGHETTTNLIGNGLVALLEWPEQKARLIAQPELISTAIEEFLRFESSNQLGNRITTVDTRIGDVDIAAGSRISLCIGAGNRDPQQFPEPDRLDISRNPNRHLAFASGIHQCAGMFLARLEGRVAISRLLARFPDYQLTATPVRGGRARFRGFLSVPCKLQK
ncbi:cytochrome P450 [Undibacterium sp. TS12]|uniref:cytochrome P450 n=1 Tax=Undibacterium sp. TS12 TaxID=2908202 RepID=UPI001F4C83BF|nr:cytochrome P450 [Undibacterium sp. TS12]MCH8621436.1 cytochrome P450 [Undibacterium sp. TS12]